MLSGGGFTFKPSQFQFPRKKKINQSIMFFQTQGRKNEQLIEACRVQGDFRKVERLIRDGANVNYVDKYGWTPLRKASFYGHNSIAKLLIDNGADINAFNTNGWTPLHYASDRDNETTVKLLVDNGSAINAAANTHLIPLHIASKHGHMTTAKLLVENGADLNAIDTYGRTSLHWASYFGHESTAKLLIDSGADVDAYSHNGWTPLHWASHFGHVEVTKALIENGANLLARSSDSKFPIDFAREKEYFDLVIILEEAAEELQEEANPFFRILFDSQKRIYDTISAYEVHKELVNAISNPPEFKIYYTLAKYSIKQQILTQERVRPLLAQALATIAPLCTSEHALVVFKVIQDKCRADGLLSDEDFHRLDNRAEVKRVEHAEFICEMKKAIQQNASAITGLEGRMEDMAKNVQILDQNIRNVNQNVEKLKDAIMFKMKVDNGVSLIRICLNAATFGIGGEFAPFFSAFTHNIIDFGDTAHVVEVIARSASSCNPQEGEIMKEDFAQGAELATSALEGAASIKVDQEMERAMREGRELVAIGFAATIAQHPIDQHHPAAPPRGRTGTRAPMGFDIWHDAAFDDDKEDEELLPLHFAVKYSLAEDLENMLSDGITSCGERLSFLRTDSEGRTALDLAALTGQTKLMAMLKNAGVPHQKYSKARMQATAAKRSKHVDAYKKYILDHL